jgi:hypothetical protein
MAFGDVRRLEGDEMGVLVEEWGSMWGLRGLGVYTHGLGPTLSGGLAAENLVFECGMGKGLMLRGQVLSFV